jgi:hypothetical protein
MVLRLIGIDVTAWSLGELTLSGVPFQCYFVGLYPNMDTMVFKKSSYRHN